MQVFHQVEALLWVNSRGFPVTIGVIHDDVVIGFKIFGEFPPAKPVVRDAVSKHNGRLIAFSGPGIEEFYPISNFDSALVQSLGIYPSENYCNFLVQ